MPEPMSTYSEGLAAGRVVLQNSPLATMETMEPVSEDGPHCLTPWVDCLTDENPSAEIIVEQALSVDRRTRERSKDDLQRMFTANCGQTIKGVTISPDQIQVFFNV